MTGSIPIARIECVCEGTDKLHVSPLQILACISDRRGGAIVALGQLPDLLRKRDLDFELREDAGMLCVAEVRDHMRDRFHNGTGRDNAA